MTIAQNYNYYLKYHVPITDNILHKTVEVVTEQAKQNPTTNQL